MIYGAVGIVFGLELQDVLLIKKDRPERQAGLYNYPGGKLEAGEHPTHAMRREFREETGLDIPIWFPVTRWLLETEDYTIFFFAQVADITKAAQQPGETEVPEIHGLPDLLKRDISEFVNGPDFLYLLEQAKFTILEAAAANLPVGKF